MRYILKRVLRALGRADMLRSPSAEIVLVKTSPCCRSPGIVPLMLVDMTLEIGRSPDQVQLYVELVYIPWI